MNEILILLLIIKLISKVKIKKELKKIQVLIELREKWIEIFYEWLNYSKHIDFLIIPFLDYQMKDIQILKRL